MKRSEKKTMKKVLGIYRSCMDAIKTYSEPEVLVDNKGIVRKVIFPKYTGYVNVLNSKINRVNTLLK
jgi:hypothetical protein